MELTRRQVETWTALASLGWATVQELSDELGVPVLKTVSNRLQALQRLRMAQTNGQRGAFARWRALDGADVAPPPPDWSLCARVHREAKLLGGLHREHDIAALLGEPVDAVERAAAYLLRVGAMRRIAGHLRVEAPQRLTVRDVETEVREWAASLSPELRGRLSAYDLEALIGRLEARIA